MPSGSFSCGGNSSARTHLALWRALKAKVGSGSWPQRAGSAKRQRGWNTHYTTELTEPVWFYLRGEEYSNQLDDFIQGVATGKAPRVVNDFRSAAVTDKAIAKIVENAEKGMPVGEASKPLPPVAPKKRGWFGRG